jgi:hypothetical protein
VAVLAFGFGAFFTGFGFFNLVRKARLVSTFNPNVAPNKLFSFKTMEGLHAFLADEGSKWGLKWQPQRSGMPRLPEYVIDGDTILLNAWETKPGRSGDYTIVYLYVFVLWLISSWLGVIAGLMFQPLGFVNSLANFDIPDILLGVALLAILFEAIRENRERHAVGFALAMGLTLVLGVLAYFAIRYVSTEYDFSVPLVWLALVPLVGAGFKRLQDGIADIVLFVGTLAVAALQIGAPLL